VRPEGVKGQHPMTCGSGHRAMDGDKRPDGIAWNRLPLKRVFRVIGNQKPCRVADLSQQHFVMVRAPPCGVSLSHIEKDARRESSESELTPIDQLTPNTAER